MFEQNHLLDILNNYGFDSNEILQKGNIDKEKIIFLYNKIIEDGYKKTDFSYVESGLYLLYLHDFITCSKIADIIKKIEIFNFDNTKIEYLLNLTCEKNIHIFKSLIVISLKSQYNYLKDYIYELNIYDDIGFNLDKNDFINYIDIIIKIGLNSEFLDIIFKNKINEKSISFFSYLIKNQRIFNINKNNIFQFYGYLLDNKRTFKNNCDIFKIELTLFMDLLIFDKNNKYLVEKFLVNYQNDIELFEKYFNNICLDYKINNEEERVIINKFIIAISSRYNLNIDLIPPLKTKIIYVNDDLKGVKETKKWLEIIVYFYKGYFVGFSSDEKVIKNTLDINSRKSKLKLVVYNKNITLYVLDKENRINDEVLVFDIQSNISKKYFDDKMKQVIDDFFAKKLNISKRSNFFVYPKNKFFIN